MSVETQDEGRLRELMCEIGRRMYDKDLVAANEGNLSIRMGERLLVTPTGVCKGFMKPEDVAVTDLEGNEISGRRKISTEILMHVVVYRHRSDVGAVCHGHPLYATAHAVAGIPLTEALMPEVVVTLGCVPVAPYGTPSTRELADSVMRAPSAPPQSFQRIRSRSGISHEPMGQVLTDFLLETRVAWK